MDTAIGNRNKPLLTFREDGTFTIVQFTDLHLHYEEPLNNDTIALMDRILEQEKPDLVVYTGDMIGGPRCPDRGDLLRLALTPVEKAGVPWCAIYGNHDAEADTTPEKLMAIQLESPLCLTEPGPDHIGGLGNFVLTIQANDNTRAAAALYFFDSGDKAPRSIGGEAWIRFDQVAWYVQQSRRLQSEHGEVLPALAFLHIPLPEYAAAWESPDRVGSMGEPVTCPSVNSGLLAAMIERNDVRGVFCGHDHANDFCGQVHGIYLCYGHVTGCETRIDPDFMHGARVIRLQQDVPGFSTWVRLKNGEISPSGILA